MYRYVCMPQQAWRSALRGVRHPATPSRDALGRFSHAYPDEPSGTASSLAVAHLDEGSKRQSFLVACFAYFLLREHDSFHLSPVWTTITKTEALPLFACFAYFVDGVLGTMTPTCWCWRPGARGRTFARSTCTTTFQVHGTVGR